MNTSVASYLPVGLTSVNVAEPSVIGTRQGIPVLSGIGKQPVTAASIRLDTLNLEGDRQADLQVHGGPAKAVYAYPAENIAQWNDEFWNGPIKPSVQDNRFRAGSFGENLTTTGWLENDVHLGDIWSWGDALLQVTQPRSPCFKLAMVTGLPELIKKFVESGRTGWYLRVVQPGSVPVSGPITVVERLTGTPTVLEAHFGIW